MKSALKRIILSSMLVLSFTFISACGKDDDKGDSNITPTLESFEIVGEDSKSVSFIGNNGNVSTLSSNSEENPFGEGKKTIEEKINDEIDVGEQITIDYIADVNEYIYAITKIKNPSNKVISSITISGQRYTSNLFENESTKEKLVIKLFVGNISSIKNYTLESIKYIDDSSSKDITITEKVEKIVKVGTPDIASYTLNNVSITNNSANISIKIIDNDGIISTTKGSVKAILYDGESIVKIVELHVGTQNITFDNLETNKIYQYGIVTTYDKLDGNGKKHYILAKNVLSIKEFNITKANVVGGTVTVNNTATEGEIVNVTAVPNGDYLISEMYYIEEGSSSKNYFGSSFIMPNKNVTVYVNFGDVVYLHNKEDLIDRFKNTNYLGEKFILCNDINLEGIEWSPIGNKELPFTGELDGNGFRIYNFKITTPRDNNGLFGYSKGTIKNLNVTNFIVEYEHDNVYSTIGGITGVNYEGIISNCYASGNVVTTSDTYGTKIGGIVGFNYSGTIINSYASVNISASSIASSAGGLIGLSTYGTISYSYATGNVSVSEEKYHSVAGGLIGSTYYVTISNCYATGNISSSHRAGGLVGDNDNINADNCYRYIGQEIDSWRIATNLGNELSMEEILNYVYNNWDNTIWNLSLSENPTLK